MFYGQQHNIRCAYGDNSLDPTVQHRWLDDILENRLQVLAQYYPSPIETYDPMLLFSNIMAQATVINFCRGMRSIAGGDHDGQLAHAYEERGLAAAEKMISLARVLKDFHIFKASPRAHRLILKKKHTNRLTDSSIDAPTTDACCRVPSLQLEIK